MIGATALVVWRNPSGWLRPFLSRSLSSSCRYRNQKVYTDGMNASQISKMEKEMCLVVDVNDKILGYKSKKDCHLMSNGDSILHRAFSVLLFNEKNELVLTRRAKSKITFPGYYTNACCSHPHYVELEMESADGLGAKRAAQRQLKVELGIDPIAIPLRDMVFTTRLLYKCPSSEVWGENELDYLLVVKKAVALNPNPEEVDDIRYLSKSDLRPFLDNVERNGGKVTPWFKLIVDKFLFLYWDNIDNLKEVTDTETIHNLY